METDLNLEISQTKSNYLASVYRISTWANRNWKKKHSKRSENLEEKRRNRNLNVSLSHIKWHQLSHICFHISLRFVFSSLNNNCENLVFIRKIRLLGASNICVMCKRIQIWSSSTDVIQNKIFYPAKIVEFICLDWNMNECNNHLAFCLENQRISALKSIIMINAADDGSYDDLGELLFFL